MKEQEAFVHIQAPLYEIDLDVHPRLRWKHVIEDYKEEILAFHEEAKAQQVIEFGILHKIVPYFVGKVSRYRSSSTIPRRFMEELEGIAEVTSQWNPELNVERWLVINLAYDSLAACTSMVFENEKSKVVGPMHFRTMDWDMVTLNNLTVDCVFTSKARPIFRTTTWPGFVGIMTGLCCESPDVSPFGVSINYRILHGTPIRNIWAFIKSAWPLTFAIREAIESCKSYDEAKLFLEQAPLISPVYIILSGKENGEGCIITRSQNATDDVRLLSKEPQVNNHHSVVQGNMDHWLSIDDCPDLDDYLVQNSIQRCEDMKIRLKGTKWSTKNIGIIAERGLKALNCESVIADDTVYSTIIIPSKSYLESSIVYRSDLV